MKEQLIRFETAKLAKEKGFRVHSHDMFYQANGKLSICHMYSKQGRRCQEAHEPECLAPIQSLLQKWLREEHNIIVVSLPYTTTSESNVSPSYIWMIYEISASTKEYQPFNTYEEALEQGLIEALKLIKV